MNSKDFIKMVERANEEAAEKRMLALANIEAMKQNQLANLSGRTDLLVKDVAIYQGYANEPEEGLEK
jgi:hypothetical protein